MRPPIKITGPGTYDDVRDAYRKEKNPKDRQKLQAIKMGFVGAYSTQHIADVVGCSRASITNWVRAWRQGGMTKLLKRQKQPGRPGQIHEDIRLDLIAGLEKGRWKTAKEIRQWLKKNHGVKLKKSGMYYWLNKLGAKPKVPRKSHAKKDETQVQAFKENLVDRLDELKLNRSKPFRLWVIDEHRYGLISTVRRCWSLKGVKPTAPYHTKYQWGYVYGGLEVQSGHGEFLYAPTVTLEITRLFLQQISAREPEAEHVVIQDGAGFHPRQGDRQVPLNIHLIELPPYSPELNPVEKLWNGVKRRYSNQVYETLEAIEEDISEVLRPYWEDGKTVLRLLGLNNYLLDSANAT